MSKHTPAPWIVRFRADGSSYISMGDPSNGPHKAADLFLTADGGDSDLADARLIAAAPELLIELRQAVIQMEMAAECIQEGRYDEALLHASSLMRSKRAAIAKATGE